MTNINIALLFGLLLFSLSNCRKESTSANSDPILPETKPLSDIIMGVDDAGDDGFWDGTMPYNLIGPMKELGADFLVHHYNPRVPQFTAASQEQYVKDLNAFFEKSNIKYLINCEISNTWPEEQASDNTGWNWVKGPNNTHRFSFRPTVLELLNNSRAFEGVVYDEQDHVQVNQNWMWNGTVKMDVPYLGNTDGMTFEQANQLVNDNAKILVNEIKSKNTPRMVSEHSFPLLMHNFAKAGECISYKQLSCSWSNIMAAIGMGAAIQYNTEMWTCLDLWGPGGTYPGHTPEMLKNNLIFGYWMGNDRMYVENINYKGSLYKTDANGITLSEYGKVYKWFTYSYLGTNHRGYTFRDVKPEIAIIRFDDTDFGIGPDKPWGLTDRPFGSNTLKFGTTSYNWMKIWNLVSQGVIPTPENGISWFSYPTSISKKSFASMNGVVVFDETVGKEHLQTLKLAFLTGLIISHETLTAVEELVVTNGLTVVSTPELAPAAIKQKYSGSGTQVINDGTTGGCWIVTDDFLAQAVKTKVQPFLGKNDEISYRFGSKEVTMKIGANEQLSVLVK